MERERYSDEDAVERESDEATQSAEEKERAQAVYGDTDMDPNRDDQRSAHHADSDEHV